MTILKRGAALACAAALAMAVNTTAAGASPARHAQAGTTYNVGVVLTYSNTDFWSAYDAYQSQFAKQLNVHLYTTTPTNGSVEAQNSAIESLITVQHVKAVIVNPESADSLGGAVGQFVAAHHANIISVDTTLSSGHAYVVVRASNLIYGEDACALMSSQFRSGDVADLEGDLASSNGADRTNSFNACMKVNDPGVTILKYPTVWDDTTAVSDAHTAYNLYTSKLKGIYSQWSSPETGIVGIYGQGTGFLRNYNVGARHISFVADDGVPFEMCNIEHGATDAAQSQPANLYAEWSLKFAIDAIQGVKLRAGESFSGLSLVSQTYSGDTNLGYPIVAPFITQKAMTLHLKSYTINGTTLGGTVATTPVSDHSTWGWVYTKQHGGNPCTVS
ncbi:MAG TPA: substrate-binding domain-containing protein [Acidimicrobiales bacterium]|nr:substrate-binding domain-containing protein [Acidimicrobiales bacterium]